MPAFSLVAAVAAAVLGVGVARRARLDSLSSLEEYSEFCAKFGREIPQDEDGLRERMALFQQRQEAVRQHNARPGIRWRAAVNKFADFTHTEFKALLGHKPARSAQAPRSAAPSLMEFEGTRTIAASVDWNNKLNLTRAKNQGRCGSCWAVAAVGAVESHVQISGAHAQALSYEQLVDCVQNPRECGGTGGCRGATAELAFDFIKQHGIVKASDYKGYQTGGSLIQRLIRRCTSQGHPFVGIGGFVKLPENKLEPLMAALANHGPVAVSVDGSGWSMYGGGVFDECKPDTIVNHAVLCMGYGSTGVAESSSLLQNEKTDYFLIRNSWGPDWGEHGFLRLLRHSSSSDHCGVDTRPQDGSGCKGGPPTLPVCGMCGVLSDSSYPTGVKTLF